MNSTEPTGATVSTILAYVADVANANNWLQFAIGALTLAWWVRIWWNKPNCPPPPNLPPK